MCVFAGNLLCIHSVCVGSELRRQGIATRMLKHYLQHVTDNAHQVDKIALICKKALVDLYTGCGFHVIGESPIVFGKEKWWGWCTV